MIAYRDGTPDDAAAIDALFRRSFADTFAHLYDPKDLAAFLADFTEAGWRRDLADPRFAFRLAEDDGTLAGYAKLSPLLLPAEPAGPAVELRQFYILKPWHGAGIAPVLMDWVLAEARRRGAGELYLSVFTDNHRARRFYARYGFEPVGPYAFMVGSQADEDIIMRLKL
ncbi:MAG TPA: GNAT family N-acetyltransferase [Allosphingosinicella sp.]|nr:GNAT family N-acetyltransferase [Allosphingosinicella sp.]